MLRYAGLFYIHPDVCPNHQELEQTDETTQIPGACITVEPKSGQHINLRQ